MTNTTGSEETWTYMRDNQAGRQAAAAPFLMIPVVGIVVAGNELDKRGGIQSATLIVVFNSAGRVKSVNMSKTAVNHINN